MNKKEILQKCDMIYSVFDDLESARSGSQRRDYGEIRSFAFGLLDEGKRMKSILGEDYEEKLGERDGDLTDLTVELFETGFVFGYAIGRLLETGYPKTENAVKSIQSLLKEKSLLPYFPREMEKSSSHHYDELGGPIEERRKP
jgi:hypothetical protein